MKNPRRVTIKTQSSTAAIFEKEIVSRDLKRELNKMQTSLEIKN